MSYQNCPRCKFDSLRLTKGILKCSSPGCPHVNFSPITFENDVRNFEGEKTVESRFAVPYNSALENGGLMFEFEGNNVAELNNIQWGKQSKETRDYKQAQKLINKWGESLKIPERIQDLAIIRFGEINKRLDGKGSFKKRDVSAYALYNAACEESEYFIDEKLIKRAGISEPDWEKVKRDLNKELQGKMYVPKEPPAYYALKYCRQKNIDKSQKDAIMRIVKQFKEKQVQGGEKQSTVAACAIWVVLRQSQTYGGVNGFSLPEIAGTFGGKTDATVKKLYQKSVEKLLLNGDIVLKFQTMKSPKNNIK